MNLDKRDIISNAVLMGMALQDAYTFAACTEAEMLEFSEDECFQLDMKSKTAAVEYQLLDQLQQVIKKQVNQGREGAITWLLEHTNPRYSGKPQTTLPDLHLHIDSSDPTDYDNVTIYKPQSEAQAQAQAKPQSEDSLIEELNTRGDA